MEPADCFHCEAAQRIHHIAYFVHGSSHGRLVTARVSKGVASRTELARGQRRSAARRERAPSQPLLRVREPVRAQAAERNKSRFQFVRIVWASAYQSLAVTTELFV